MLPSVGTVLPKKINTKENKHDMINERANILWHSKEIAPGNPPINLKRKMKEKQINTHTYYDKLYAMPHATPPSSYEILPMP
jgi:hypothetical protein